MPVLSVASLPTPASAPPQPRSRGVAAAAPTHGIVFRGAIYGGSGYADGNQDILRGLEAHDLPVQLAPIGLQQDLGGLLGAGRQRQLAALQQRRFDLSRSVFYQSCPPSDFELQLDAKVRIGRAAFETDTLPGGWAARCNQLDQIWVPSQFNGETFARGGADPRRLRVLPEGVDTSRFRPGLTPLPLPQRRGFNFLSIFDWIDRKGPDVLLRAYLRAFTSGDDVALILKTFKFDEPDAALQDRLIHFIEREAGVPLEKAPLILLVQGLLPAADMPRLYAAADAFVLPSRGEGWGRPYMEAAACQVAVVATRWSGHLDFLHDENSYLIDIEGVQPAPRTSDRDIYIGQGWAEPSVEHLAELMRQIVQNRQIARQRARRARREMVERWDTRVIAKMWAQAFQELLA
ncbi:MAG: glycosyltransferase [Terriglobales bacterium]